MDKRVYDLLQLMVSAFVLTGCKSDVLKRQTKDSLMIVILYYRGGQITAHGPDPAHRSVSSGPLVPAETTTIILTDLNFC